MPDSRTIIRGAVLGAGLITLVGVSVLAGRLSAREPAEAPQPRTAAATQTPGQAAGGHGEHDAGGENPWLQKPDEAVKPWTKSATYTDAAGNRFTVHVKIETPTTAGMGMCSLGPNASWYSRTIVLSVRNDGAKAANGPRISVEGERVGFPHGKYGCSWTYPPDIDGEYPPGDVKTFRGLVKTDPKDQDVAFVVRPDIDAEKFLPKGEFTEAQFDQAVAKAEAAADAQTKEIIRIPAAVISG